MATDYYKLDDDGNPVPCADVMEWGVWFETANRRVAFDAVTTATGEVVRVSTVFLGLNHNFGGNGAPVLFETMIFGGRWDQDGNRYCSREDALFGHSLMVAKVRSSEEAANG